MATRILTSADIERLLTGPQVAQQLIEQLEATHRGITEGTVLQPAPHALVDAGSDPRTRAAIVPMLAHDLGSGIFVSKVLADAPSNRELGLPAQRSTVAVYDAATGECTGLIDGRALTRIRTAAVTALATRLLARPSARVLSLIGAGPLAVEHAIAVSRAWADTSGVEGLQERPGFDRLLVWSRSVEKAETAAGEIREALQGSGEETTGIPQVEVAASREEAVRAADVLCTLTPAEEPYVEADWISPGTLINAVGSPPRPHFSEILPEVFEGAALTVVDTVDIALGESGNINRALEAGTVNQAELVELGDCIVSPPSLEETDVRIFNSVGIGAQDLAAVKIILRLAEQADLGHVIPVRP